MVLREVSADDRVDEIVASISRPVTDGPEFFGTYQLVRSLSTSP